MKKTLFVAVVGALLVAAGCAHAHDTGRYHRHHDQYAAHHHHRQVVRVTPPPRVVYMPRAPRYYSYEPAPRYSYYPERYYLGTTLQVVVPLYNSGGYIYLR